MSQEEKVRLCHPSPNTHSTQIHHQKSDYDVALDMKQQANQYYIAGDLQEALKLYTRVRVFVECVSHQIPTFALTQIFLYIGMNQHVDVSGMMAGGASGNPDVCVFVFFPVFSYPFLSPSNPRTFERKNKHLKIYYEL